MNRNQIANYMHDLPWKELTLKANKFLPTFVPIFTKVLLIILLVQTAAELTWTLVTPSEEKSSSTKFHPSTSQVNTATVSLNDVSQYHLFGDAKKQPVVQQKVIDAPETRLRLTLKGVFATTEVNNALAIISSSKDKDKTYHIGDKVSGGAVLHAVYADRVILKRNGRLETLRLPKPEVDRKNFPKPKISEKPSRIKPATPSQRPTIKPAQNKRQQLRQLRDTLFKDPAKIWKQVRINPVMENGKVKGYTMSHNDQGLMKALNIRNTDIITGVNGQSLNDPATLYGLMDSLSEQQTLELAIERNGKRQFIQLSF